LVTYNRPRFPRIRHLKSMETLPIVFYTRNAKLTALWGFLKGNVNS
jgi:hypothetical protein